MQSQCCGAPFTSTLCVMTDLLAKFARGLPVTLIAALAVVVLVAWLLGGVGRPIPRIAAGFTWLVVLLTCWAALLYGPESRPDHDPLVWLTYIVTGISFFVPIVWRKWFSRT